MDCTHIEIGQALREKLLAQIAELGQKEGKEKDKKLKDLLSKSFMVVKIKALRPVVMTVMKHLSHVDEKYLKVLVSSSVFFSFSIDNYAELNFSYTGERQRVV